MNTVNPSAAPYVAPAAAEIASRQDRNEALRPLLAQRALYSKAKRFLAYRMWGMGIIAIAAPAIAFVWPGTQVAIGAIAGAWLALGRLYFSVAEKRYAQQGAAVQEQFDAYVFDMPEVAVRTNAPSLEERAMLAGVDSELQTRAVKEELLGWYPMNPQDSGTTAVAICQRANASYSQSLLSTTCRLWTGLILGWTFILIVLSIVLSLSLVTFLLAVFLPLATPIIELFEYTQSIRTASTERGGLSQEIEAKLKNNAVTDEDLMVWQARMYELRASMPQVPDRLYKWQRKRNERAMHTAAQQLSDTARQQ